MHENGKRQGWARYPALIYTALSGLAALAFYGGAQLRGGYPAVAIFGGMLWVFLLSMIVTMPLVTAWAKSLCPPSPPEGGRGRG
jgi:hypothetical protein